MLGKRGAKALAKKLGGNSPKLKKRVRPTNKEKIEKKALNRLTKSDMFKPSILKDLSNKELMEQLLRLNLVPKDFKKGGMVKKGK
tara:strand:+ start:76 stop:330 length:255 start_codon:yes stop_codon:yes gene_type:complete